LSEGSTADSVVPGLHSNHLVHKSFTQSNALFFLSFTFSLSLSEYYTHLHRLLLPMSFKPNLFFSHHSHSLKYPTKVKQSLGCLMRTSFFMLWWFVCLFEEVGASYNIERFVWFRSRKVGKKIEWLESDGKYI